MMRFLLDPGYFGFTIIETNCGPRTAFSIFIVTLIAYSSSTLPGMAFSSLSKHCVEVEEEFWVPF